MRKKLMVFILSTLPLVIIGCGDNGGAASGKWVGEAFESSNSKTSTIVGEFDSYVECVAETQKEAKSGIFNCGIK